jgi:maltose/moltooligosaccharide transporter
MGGVGAIISFLGGAALYKVNPAYPFWLGSVLVVLASLLVFIFIKEPKEFSTEVEEKPGVIKSLVEVFKANEKSALRILLAIFCWFVAYNAIEAFFTLYAVKHLNLTASDGARLLGQLSLLFVIFALPAGYLGAHFGRRKTILIGVALLGACMLAMFLVPAGTLVIQLTKLPILGVVPVVGIILMVAGMSWALININSLPMVVDMTEDARVGTFTGLYYLFSTLAAIAGPNINGLVIQFSGNNYSLIMLVGPIFMVLAFIMMMGVRRGEKKAVER